nr:hypothetical protein [Methylorubrum zatmanii]
MNNPIAMPELGNDIYLRLTLKDMASIQSSYSSSLEFTLSVLFYGLKNAQGESIESLRARGVQGILNINQISAPLSILTARASQAWQQVITG